MLERQLARLRTRLVLPQDPNDLLFCESRSLHSIRPFKGRTLAPRGGNSPGQVRGHLAEYGWIVPKGVPHVDRLIARVEDPAEVLPPAARTILLVLVSTLRTLDQQIAVLDAEIASRARHDPVARRLMTIPRIGPITATALVALAPSHEAFKSGRHFAAWLGLTPRQRSTGGQQKLGAITKMGERTLGGF